MKKYNVLSNFKLLNKKGFTLIELLVVISIIGILVAIGAASYTTSQKLARDARRKGDLKAIQDAKEQYYSNTGSYSTSCVNGDVIPSPVDFRTPSDPKNQAPYTYRANICRTTLYCICALLEKGSGGNSSNFGCNWVDDGNRFCVQQRQ